jgi:transcriptional regulator with XRE-family HTH domain
LAFKDNLRRLRISNGYSNKKHFAEVLGINYTTYNGYEDRGTLPPEGLIIKMAQTLNATIDELFGYSPITKERDIDIAVKQLNRMGINTVMNEEQKMVGIFIRRDTQFTIIPYNKIVDIMKSTEGLFFLNSVKNHVLYSFVMRSIISYADPKKMKKKAPVTKIDINSEDAGEQLLQAMKKTYKKGTWRN